MEYVDTLILPLADLRPFPGNARIHDLDTIEESIRQNGQYRSLVVRVEDDGTRTILAGNGTAEVLADRLGVTEARCELIRCDDDEEAVRINLVDNKASDLARFDDEKLLANLRSVNDLRGTGFVPSDTDALAERLRRHARTEAKAAEALAAARSDDALVADDGTRTLVCRYHPDAYTWVAARLRECREEWSLATNGEALLRLLEEKFGASTLTARRARSA